MSQRAHINQTPETHPHLYREVQHSEVAAGDVYKGTKLGRRTRTYKWYANTEGQNCVDKHRRYFRPNTPIPQSALGPVLAKKHQRSTEGASPAPCSAPSSAASEAPQHAPGAPCAAGPMEEDDDEAIELFMVSIAVSKSGLRRAMAILNGDADANG